MGNRLPVLYPGVLRYDRVAVNVGLGLQVGLYDKVFQEISIKKYYKISTLLKSLISHCIPGFPKN